MPKTGKESVCIKSVVLSLHYAVQVGLALRQRYLPEKRRANQTKDKHLNQRASCKLGDSQPYSIRCMTTPLVDTDL